MPLKKIVIQYDINNKFIKKFSSIIEASKKLNIDSSLIIKVCKNKRKTAGGYVWKYNNF